MGLDMVAITRIIVSLAMFAVCFYTLSALRVEHLFRKNTTTQIQLFYILSSMALAYLVVSFLYSLLP
ncbi:MAG: DUF1146 domain-containing protein [Erysipelotrichaceae bacterium]|nr:DUF1146 domain-containing protein [Erysipelotrichaceae bacterium]MBQ9987197.1 DUF1146 domain-containing protein [Erysipelotrichales bacterium]MBR3693494.1 DUF1146 domain-containing protein [Erysipelotrichales bacterium]